MNDFEQSFTDRDRSSNDYISGVVVEVIESHDDEAFFVERGHTDDFVDQLIRKSRQELIVQNCPKDSSERFSSREAFEQWLQKEGGRTSYFLADPSGELAGIVWYGRAELDADILPDFPAELKPNHTFAIRIYDGFNGKGLAKDFIRTTMADYLEQQAGGSQSDDFNGFHLETDKDNQAAIRLYEAIGYIAVDPDDDSDRLTMVMHPEDAERFAFPRQTESD